jgi:macrodomain Ter protein organizer (MatP/YcbG family)
LNYLTTHKKPIPNTAWVRARLCELQKRMHSTRSDTVYQLLAHGQWFSPGTPASSTTKTGRHDIAEILLKVALNTKNQSIFGFHTDWIK